MSGGLSAHIVNQHEQSQARTGPFGQSSSPTTHVSTHGPMSFNPYMHGGGFQSQPYLAFGELQSSFIDLSETTTMKIAELQAKLNRKLGPEFISQRPGPGGGPKLTYAEGWKIINLANEVFGFNGWSSRVVSLTTDFIDFNEESRRYTVGVTSIMRVTLRDGVYHEDIGYGMLENSKSKGAALDKCKKEAVTDGLKRALRNFGNLLGNCLYDKSYTQEVIKIKIIPPKFDQKDLHRRPEFDESKPNIASTSSVTLTTTSASTSTPTAKTERPGQQTSISKPLISLPPHMRAEARNSTISTTTPDTKGKGKAPALGAVRSNGLNTPLTTPAQCQQSALSKGNEKAKPQPLIPQIVPKQPQQQSERRVTFADTKQGSPPRISKSITGMDADPGEAGDDSFHFCSDDDAFLAAVDLGDGDLGRPIDYEEGIGGVVSDGSFTDFEDSILEGAASRQTLPIRSDHVKHDHHQREPCQASEPDQHQDRAKNQIYIQDTNNTAGPSCSSSLFSGNLQQQKPQLPSNQRPQQQHSLNVNSKSSNPEISNPSSRNTRTHQNQNINESSPSVSRTNGASAKRPSTPSTGGFHFPPGMNPLAQAKQGPPHSSHRPAAAGTSSSGIGTKRSADVMTTNQVPSKRPAQGMGLQHTGEGTRREPLGRLDIGEGGDVKRIRR